MTEQDDMENWLYATRASSGTIARRYPFNYQMSMGAYKTNDPMPGDVSLQITEQTPRNFYRVYANYLGGGDWNSLLGLDRDPARARRRSSEAMSAVVERPRRGLAWYALKQEIEGIPVS